MNDRGRSAYEAIIVVIVVALTGVLAVGLYAERNKVDKGRVLNAELSSLRTSVVLYTLVNRAHPVSLEALVEEAYEPGDGSERPYAEFVHRDARGRFIDPFGSPYAYDPDVGWVASVTEGYETW